MLSLRHYNNLLVMYTSECWQCCYLPPPLVCEDDPGRVLCIGCRPPTDHKLLRPPTDHKVDSATVAITISTSRYKEDNFQSPCLTARLWNVSHVDQERFAEVISVLRA